MKKFPFLVFIILIAFQSYGQPWLKNLPANKSKGTYTYFDYQRAFEDYFVNQPEEREREAKGEENESGDGWMQFKRWEYAMHGVINLQTGEFPKKTAQQVRDEYYKTHAHSRSGIASNWSSLGPDYSFSGYSGIGRLNCVAFHPTDLNTYWVGAGAGGLWVTHDDGDSWTCLTDQNGVLGVSDIIIPADYDSSRTIYIGTGDREIWDNRSIGVLKSTDEGLTWNLTGLTFSIYDGAMVNRLLMDPNNSNVLIAATSWGVYKTEDGGEAWDHQLTGTEFIDMEYRPGDFNVMSGSTKYGQIYYTDNGGNTWTRPFNDPDARRIELAVSPAQPNWLYALAAGDDAGLYGIFKSEDYGQTYAQIFYRDTANLLTWASDGSEDGGQGWYDLCLAASPTNPNSLLLGGVNSWRSNDGGITWKIVNHWYGDQVQAVHADKHNIRYRYNGDVFECNDGGVYLSKNNGTGWADKTNGIVISQMYRLGVSQTAAGDIITGLQDNGTKPLSNGSWQDVIGGDGMECMIDYTDSDVQYGTVYFGYLERTDHHWNGSMDITPYAAGDGAWVTPYVLDPVDPNIIYGGFKDLWRTLDKGETWDSISAFNSSSVLQSVAVAPSDQQVIYVATYNKISSTTDGGGEWKNITFNLPSDFGSIEYIAVSHDDPFTLWVALSGYHSPGIYQYSAADSAWTNVSTGLPPIPVYTVVENKQSKTELQLFAGTELGIFLKKGDEDWVPYTNGLPNVRIGELEMYYDAHPGKSRLRAATYGRGLWETPVPTAPEGGTAVTISPACFNQSGVVQLVDYFGNIQWQQSVDGISGWENVSEGSGANDEVYTTESLSGTMYYRAELTQSEFAQAYSTVTEVNITLIPGAAGAITGNQIVCQGALGEVYHIDTIENATAYEWILPSGISGNSASDSIVLSFDEALGMTEIQVKGLNGNCEGVSSSLLIVVNAMPQAPAADTIQQPDCENSTGTISFLNLPDWGPWELINAADTSLIFGEGNAYDLVGLLPGEYSFEVRNSFGCLSDHGNLLVIQPQPLTPAAPLITYNEFELHSDALSGNQWYNEFGIILGATGQDYMPLEAGTYYVVVTLNGCSSDPSNSIQLFNESVGPDPHNSMVHVFPNPMQNELTIEVIGDTKALEFEVVNALGQFIIGGTFVQQVVINTFSFPSGLYLVKVAIGPDVIMNKVVKE